MPNDWREWRMLLALHLKQQDWYQRNIGAALEFAEPLDH
jgi:hypothetical protein